MFVSGVAALRAAIHWLLDAAHGEGAVDGPPEDGPRAKGLLHTHTHTHTHTIGVNESTADRQ